MSEEITSFQQIEASAHLEELIEATQNLHDFARDSICNRLTDSVALIRGGGRLDVVTKRLKEDIDTLSDLGALPNGQAKENFYNALRYPSSSLFDSVFSAFSEVMTTNGVYPVLGNNPLRKPSIHDGLLVYPVGGQSAYVLSRRPLVAVQPFALTTDFYLRLKMYIYLLTLLRLRHVLRLLLYRRSPRRNRLPLCCRLCRFCLHPRQRCIPPRVLIKLCLQLS